jgi:hypothetical protein
MKNKKIKKPETKPSNRVKKYHLSNTSSDQMHLFNQNVYQTHKDQDCGT